MARGGHREGAGRKSGWNYSETQTIRVPVVFAEQLLEIAKKLDNNESIDFVSESISRERLEEIIQEILVNPEITRNGKDKGTVKRTLKAMMEKLLSI